MTCHEALRISQQLGFLERPKSPLLDSPAVDPDDDHHWMNIDDGADIDIETWQDTLGDHYARHQKSLQRAEARATIQTKWMALGAQLTATYLHLQHNARNWTSEPTFQSYLSNELQCQCSPEKLRHRHLDLIDLLSQFG